MQPYPEPAEEAEDETIPPHNRLAEEAILGAVLKSPNAIAEISHLLPEDFYDQRFRTIWRAMLDLWQRNTPVDFTTVAACLNSRYASAGVTLRDLVAIDLAVPSAANVEHYAQLVSDAATQRRFIDAAQTVAAAAWRRGTDVDDLEQQATALLTAARGRRSRRNLFDPERWAESLELDVEARTLGQRTSVSTGLIDLDKMTLGFAAGSLILLMGTPGTGKSDLAMQIAIHVGRTHGPVLFASLEMSEVELGHRFARLTRGMDRNNLARGSLSDPECDTFRDVLEAMRVSRFWPATPTGMYTTQDLRADAMEVQAKAGHVALIVADYVQRFDDGDRLPQHREINVGMVAKGLKSLAREFGCPVLAPVQPNREHASRMNKRPLLTDLRESGKLEQEADIVLGLYRDEKHDMDSEDRGIAEVHMLKNRSGVGDSDGSRRLQWVGTRYDNFAGPRLRSVGALP